MFGNRLRELRLQRNLTQQDLAKLLNVSPSTIGMYEQGRRDPDTHTIVFLANYFGVTTDYLLGTSTHKDFDLLAALEDPDSKIKAGDTILTPQQRLGIVRVLDNPALLEDRIEYNHIPILGQIKMGIPLLAEENYTGELEIPSDIDADFALEARGNSMIGVGLLDGDYAICRKQQTAYSGDIVVALNDITEGYSEATLKFYFNEDNEGPVLRAANPNFKDIPLDGDYRIAGVLVAVLRKGAPAYRVYNSYLAARDINKKRWDPVIEKAFHLGIKPEQLIHMLDTMYQIMKGTDK